jgi:hypothetical protein
MSEAEAEAYALCTLVHILNAMPIVPEAIMQGPSVASLSIFGPPITKERADSQH